MYCSRVTLCNAVWFQDRSAYVNAHSGALPAQGDIISNLHTNLSFAIHRQQACVLWVALQFVCPRFEIQPRTELSVHRAFEH